LPNEPDKLHPEIQKAIDGKSNADIIYLSDGLCGKSLEVFRPNKTRLQNRTHVLATIHKKVRTEN